MILNHYSKNVILFFCFPIGATSDQVDSTPAGHFAPGAQAGVEDTQSVASSTTDTSEVVNTNSNNAQDYYDNNQVCVMNY